MPIYTSGKGGEGFEPAPEGLHQAVCVDVVDRGLLPTQFGPKHKVDVIWQVVPMDDDGNEVHDKKGKRYQVLQRYTNSIHPKSLLGQHLKSWRGKPFTDAEIEKFDLEALIGVNCQIQVVHNPGSDGKVWANVQAIVKANPKSVKLRPHEYTRIKDKAAANAHPEDVVEEQDADLPF